MLRLFFFFLRKILCPVSISLFDPPCDWKVTSEVLLMFDPLVDEDEASAVTHFVDIFVLQGCDVGLKVHAVQESLGRTILFIISFQLHVVKPSWSLIFS